MDNVTFINQYKNTYESLRYFFIEENFLMLYLNGTYKIPISNVNLNRLPQNLFSLDPNEIFYILYMLQLLPQTTISLNEQAFITNYVSRYLKLNDMALTESNLDTNLIWGLSIPIYSSYNSQYENNMAAKVIHQLIDSHTEEIENSKGKHPRLVLTNPNFQNTCEDDTLTIFEKAGFTTILLIVSTIAITCTYIAYFIVGK